MNAERICRALEITRWVGVVAGFQFAFFLGGTPAERLHILAPWVVGSLAGLTAVESLFFGKAASRITGYAPSGYQRQSGLNNLALAVMALLVWYLGWGTLAEAAVMNILLIFLFLSACNHAWSAWKEQNRNARNLLRPVLTAALIAFALPLVVSAVRAAE
jgi:hypothetical protein